MKKWLSCVLILACLIGIMSVKAFADSVTTSTDDVFDYSPFEQYDAKSPFYSYEEDKFDSQWLSSIFIVGEESNLMFYVIMTGDLKGESMCIIGSVEVIEDEDLVPEKLQFLIDDNVYTVDFSLLEGTEGFYFYGDNGKSFLEALNKTDEFSVRMKVDGENYDDTFEEDIVGCFADFKFMIDTALKQNAIDKIPSDFPEVLERYLPITVK